MRKIHIISRATLFMAATTLAIMLQSCSNDNSSTVLYYDDTAITSFTLGTLKQLVNTTDDNGNLTTTYQNLDCSSYKFYIDQATRQIYNVDSLPVGVDPTRIVCTVAAKNGGYMQLRNTESGEYETFSASDSIDFTSPRRFRVTAQSGAAYLEYDIRVNVHKEKADSFVWRPLLTTNTQIAAMTNLRAVNLDGRMLLFGASGSAGTIMSTQQTDGRTWNKLTTNLPSPSADIAFNIAKQADKLYLYDGGKLYSTYNATNWTLVGEPSLRQLIGSDGTRLYAISASGNICASDDEGNTWTEEDMDNPSSLLPTQDISFLTLPSRTNAADKQLIIIGNRNNATDNAAQVWGKMQQSDASAQQQAWAYYPMTSDVRYPAPHLTNLQAVVHGSQLIALGGKAMNQSTLKTFDAFYVSDDYGVTWPADEYLDFPENFSCNEQHFALASDSDNYIWLICATSGQVWKGRRNKLGWQTYEQYVTE